VTLGLRYSERVAVVDISGTSTYAVSLDLANLSPGRYRVTLALARGTDAPATSIRELELIDH